MSRRRSAVLHWLLLVAATLTVAQSDLTACYPVEPLPTAPVAIDRGLQQPLSTARSLIARGEYREAIRSLQPIMSDRQSHLVLVNGRYVDAKMEANWLIGSLPPAAMALYEREVGGFASRELKHAQATGRLDDYLIVATTYRHTASGREALAAAAGLFFDSGRFLEAAAAAHELLETSGMPAQDSAATARLVMAWLELGQIDRAQQWFESRREFLTRHEIRVQESKIRLDRWVDECIHRRLAGTPPNEVPAVGGHPQAVPQREFRHPSTSALWTRHLGEAGVVEKLVDESIVRRTKTGIAPVFHGVPLVVGQTLVVRGADEIAAFDLRTGERRWSNEISPVHHEAQRNTLLLQNESLAPLFVESLVDRLFTGGAHTAISADKERVFIVIEDATGRPAPVFRRRNRRGVVEAPPKNSLAAYDLRDGKTLWRISEIGTTDSLSSTRDVRNQSDFFGPPLALGGTLYVLGRTEDGTSLLALDPNTGTIRWQHSLSGFSGFEADLASSHGPACVPVESDGLLICPTPEGIVIAVDPVTRTCRWAYRAPPTEDVPGMPPRWGRAFPVMEASWLHNWRETIVRVDGDRCFFISPRSNAIHALAIQTGKLLWTSTVPSGLFLGPVAGGRLLAVANGRLFAFDTASGAAKWNVSIGLPAGRGFAAKDRYYLPQASGGLAIVDPQSGRVRFSPDSTLLGNLVPIVDVAGAAVAQCRDQLALLPSLENSRNEAAEELRRKPTDGKAAIRLARLSGEAGDFESAQLQLRSLLQSQMQDTVKSRVPESKNESATTKEKDAVREEISPDGIADVRRELFKTIAADIDTNPQRCEQLELEFLRIATGNEERTFALRTIAVALIRSGQRLLGLELFLHLAEADLPDQIEIDRDSARTVAWERQIRVDLEDLLRVFTPEERRQADSRIDRLVESSIDHKDAAVLGRIARRLVGIDLKRQLLQRLETALRPDPGFLQLQLELCEATTSSSSRKAAEAWRWLAEMHHSHGDHRAAADCYRRLNADFRDTRFDDGLLPAELLNRAKADRQLAKELGNANADRWPAAAPEVIPDTDANSIVHFSELPLEIIPGSLGERLDVAIDPDGGSLRFQSESHSSYWDLHLPSERPRFHGDSLIYRGWSIGPVLVVQVGTDLFGITPIDEGGDAAPKVLWHVNLLGPDANAQTGLSLQFVPGMLGVRGGHPSILDHLGRPIARVGPVRAGYICYFDRGILAALHPLSGRLLWQRTGVSATDLCAGDDDLIVLADRRFKRVEFIRALDGKTVAQRPGAVAEIRWLEGRFAVTQVAVDGQTRVANLDLLDHSCKWTKSFSGTTQLVRLDARRYAAAEPDGTLRVLAADTGSLIASEHIVGAEHCSRVHVTEDNQRFYLAFSTPFADSDNYRANGNRDDSRNPLVNGVLCALDRASGRTLWSRRFEDGVFAVDQPRLAPFLVFMYRHVGAGDDGVGIHWPILHCINKRTGVDVYLDRLTSMPSHRRDVFVETDFGRREVVVRLPESGIRFRYSR